MLVVLGGLAGFHCAGGQYLTREEALAIAFPGADQIRAKRAIASEKQHQRLVRLTGEKDASRFFKYYEGRRNGELLGYAVIDEVKGKHQPITYMIAFSSDHRVRAIEILAYRESYGYQIRQGHFREQFYGKSVKDRLRLNREIRNIAGATISCRSMIRAVKEKLAYVSVLLPRGEPAPAPRTAVPEGTGQTAKGAAAGASQIYRERARLLMGTILEVKLFASSPPRADRATEAAFEEVARIEGLISTYRRESEVARLNARGYLGPVRVGAEVVGLIQRSRLITDRSEGSFDVTVGPLVRLWRGASTTGRVPSEGEIRRALSLVGMDHLRVVGRDRVALSRPGVRLDFGGIGKGYALDRAARRLRKSGIHQALMNFGGQILALDAPAGARGWRVDIRDPRSSRAAVAHLLVANEAVATTADDQRGWMIGGVRYSHIVDPRDGRPVRGNLSATVAGRSAERVDAWSTALFGLGTREAVRRASEEGLDLLLVTREGGYAANTNRFEGFPHGAKRANL